MVLRPLTRQVVERWIAAHDAAWRSTDPGAIADLFTETAVYHTGPWDETWRGQPGPFRGRDEIARAWIAGNIEGERFEADANVLAIEGARAVVRRRITYFQADGSIDGRWDTCWLMDFDDEGRCAEYLEWYVEAAAGD
jgi:hypothetical protein